MGAHFSSITICQTGNLWGITKGITRDRADG